MNDIEQYIINILNLFVELKSFSELLILAGVLYSNLSITTQNTG